MSLRPPTEREVVELAEQLGLSISPSQAGRYRELLAETLEVYERTEELAASNELRANAHTDREVYGRPDPTDDPLDVWVTRCRVSGDPEGPLAELEVGVKDNVAVAGVPRTLGSRVLRDHVPTYDATVVRRILEAGGTIVGTLNMDDFAFSGAGDTSSYGPTRNPHDPDRLAGGSSGGSAAAVAADEVDLAIGGDQGGSIRTPASWCGVYGLKPTYGLVPYTGVFAVDNSVDYVGPLASTVEDVAAFLDAAAGKDPLDPRQGEVPTRSYADALDSDPSEFRVGVLSEGFGHDSSDPAVDDAVRDAVGVFEDLGATVEPVSVPWHLDALPIFLPILARGAYETLRGYGTGYGWSGYYDVKLIESLGKALDARMDEFPFNVKVTALLVAYLSEHHYGRFYARAQNLRRPLRAAYDEAFEEVDLLAMPTTPQLAFEHGSDATPEQRWDHAIDPSVNTYSFNLTGHPALNVPCAKRDGLPVGMMLVGEQFDDATVLAAASAFEDHVDWTAR